MSALIIGDGIAGITAATWLRRYEAEFEWFGGERWGGILNEVYNPIIDFPGVRAPSGPAVVDRFAAWDAGDLPRPVSRWVSAIERVGETFEVSTDQGTERFDQVLVCTGTRRRQLGIPGENEGLGDWIVMSTGRAPELFVGNHVVMIGGGDAGVEGALNALDAGADRVTVVTRSELKAQRQFVDRMHRESKIAWWPNRAVPERFVDGPRRAIELSDGELLEADIVVVRIGVEPVLPRITPSPDVDRQGFIITDDRGQSSIEGLFAAGDVTSTPLRSIATSMGDGTRAARTIAEKQGIWSAHG